MQRWASMSVELSIRALTTRERSVLSEPDPGQRRCTVSLAARLGDNSWICIIETTGSYDCPLVTSDGMPPLTSKNGTTDRRGVVKLDAPLAGTHATPPLAWQRRYPHVDGFILPWAGGGTLRQGLTFYPAPGSRAVKGQCSRGSEQTIARAALRCFSTVQLDPCFARATNWDRPGTVVACASPGSTRFSRIVIARR